MTRKNLMSKNGSYFVYILASSRNGTLYVGMSSNLAKRVRSHKKGTASTFTKEYKVNMLVYYEKHEDEKKALLREKQVKKWKRRWKLRLIESANPDWRDLYCDICG